VHKLQENVNTYTEAIEETEEYKDWLSKFDLDKKTEYISNLLIQKPNITTISQELADKVTYKDFWTRYFYKYYLGNRKYIKNRSNRRKQKKEGIRNQKKGKARRRMGRR
jgi:hypothetical protein